MPKKVTVGFFDVSGFEPVITELKRYSSRSARASRNGSKRTTHQLTALRRTWRALERKSTPFAVRVLRD